MTINTNNEKLLRGAAKMELADFAGVAPTAYTQTYATAASTVPAATALTPPAGGTGATAGAYDTAGNRDLMIASITATQADLLALKKVVNQMIDDLQSLGLFG